MVAKNKKFGKRRFSQPIFFSIFIGLLLVGIVSFLVISNLRINQKRAELTNKIEALKEQIQELEKRKEELEAGISQTESETFWEEKVREQGYKKPGEETIVVLPPEEGEEGKEKEKSFWEKILEKLGF